MAKGVNGFVQFTISKAMSVEKDERKKMTSKGEEIASKMDDEDLLDMHYMSRLQREHLKRFRSLNDALNYKPKEYKTIGNRERLIREYTRNKLTEELTAKEIKKRGLVGRKGRLEEFDSSRDGKESFYARYRKKYGKEFK